MNRYVPESFVANDSYVLRLSDFSVAYVSPPEARFFSPTGADGKSHALTLKIARADIGGVRGFQFRGSDTVAVGPDVYMMWFERADDPSKVTFLSRHPLLGSAEARGILYRLRSRSDYEGHDDARWYREALDNVFGPM